MKLAGLQINVTDIEVARDFYCDVLGFEIESEQYLPSVLQVKKDGLVLFLYLTDKKVIRGETSTHVINMEIQSIKEGWDRFQRSGVTFISPEVQTCPAAHYFTILDPFGNAIDILQML